MVDKPWFHLPSVQATPGKLPSPSTAAAMVPRSSSSSSIPASPTRTPDMPVAARSSTCGTLAPAVSPGTRIGARRYPRASNITVASSGTAHFDCSVTRNTATGKPLASSSPGINGLHAPPQHRQPLSRRLRQRGRKGTWSSNTQCSNLFSPPTGTGEPSAPSTSLCEHLAFEDERLRRYVSSATRQARNVPAAIAPLAGWFSSSQSRNWPRPPNPTEPVPIPPKGNDRLGAARPCTIAVPASSW